MANNQNRVKHLIDKIEQEKTFEEFLPQLAPLSAEELGQLPNNSIDYKPTAEGLSNRIGLLKEIKADLAHVTGIKKVSDPNFFNGNIENFIGMAQIPIGLAGPLLVRGTHAQGDFYIPMATTEGALVASYSRGMKVSRLSGGITSICLDEGVQRSPFYKFRTIPEAGIFIKWVHTQLDTFHEIVKASSRFASLNEVKTNLQGNSVILTFDYSTGDASGQNMVTICTDKICKHIAANFEITPLEWYIESNYSGDKKATALSFSNVRGKKVSAELVIPRTLVEDVLKTTPEQVSKYWQSSTLAVVQSGAIGAQGHVANGLTALFIACGQDVACISESSIGLTRMEVNHNGDLYTSLTLPSLIVGTIGGGTGLPTQKECLGLLDCVGVGKAKKFAEICAAVALCGEISIAAAMSVDHFTTAHQNLGRKKD